MLGNNKIKEALTELYKISMKRTKKIIAGVSCALLATITYAKSPVIMTVNGVDVPKSEFEYLYNKNSQQQLSQLPIEDYVEMFKLYKLKVEDAKAEGIDTTTNFKREMEQYKHDLALPYLTDSVYLHKLLHEAYERSQKEVEARHIMLFKTQDPVQNRMLKSRIDSIHTILKNGANFEETAMQYSQDQGSSRNGGLMGYITAQQYPYFFELAVYNTPEGEISDVVESPVGYHIIKGGKRRDARGKVKAAHILKLTQGADDVKKEAAKNQIDSIYDVVIANPDLFEKLAKEYSEDPGSASQGGLLPVFGSGEMVAEFDSVAFSLADNTISKPFRSGFGWHIIKKIESVAGPSENDMKAQFMTRISNPQDERYALVKNNQMNVYAARHKASITDKTISELNAIASKGGIDSIFIETINSPKVSQMCLYTIDKKPVKVEKLAKRLSNTHQTDIPTAQQLIKDMINNLYYNDLLEAEEARLYKEVPNYRNLLNEYVDGSLLYEVSVKKVWDKAAKDTEGLKKYFESNRSNYKWSVPHAKGILVQATNDSIANEIRKLVPTLGKDTMVNTLRKTFRGNASFDKVLVEKGSNAMIDHLLFNGPEAKPKRNNYTTYFMIEPRVIIEPEEMSDVKGLVTNDFQNELQGEWENELKQKYPVSINSKVLKSLKK